MILQALESNGGLQFSLLIYVAWTSYGCLPTQRARVLSDRTSRKYDEKV